MTRIFKLLVLITVLGSFAFLSATSGQSIEGQKKHGRAGKAKGKGRGLEELRRIEEGFKIAPVPLNLDGKDRDLVGLGSYIVNAQAACNDCHTCPSYTDNPFEGDAGTINAENYLAGGVPFGPVVSANITPDASGKPAGLTADEYLELIRTGHDPDEPGEFLQVMPWPIFRNMTDHDIRAIYEYLSAIPHAEPGSCTQPGQPTT